MIDLSLLDNEQRCAVENTEGIYRVVAGAGSGKTRALTYRFANIIDKGLANGNQILCVTFTNKAANEMKERIGKLVNLRGKLDYITTFHSLGLKILREDCWVLGISKKFIVMDAEDTKSVVKKIIKELDSDISLKDATECISHFKCSKYGIDIMNCIGNVNIDGTEPGNREGQHAIVEIAKVVRAYCDAERLDKGYFDIILRYIMVQRDNQGLDFNDLLNGAYCLLAEFEDVRSKWQRRFKYVQVDEFQDVSEIQYNMIKILVDLNKNLFAVGDPDQTIYTWRGADVKYVLDMEKDFEDCKTIYLNSNYRSDAFIVNRSNRLIKNNERRIEKQLKPVKRLKIDVKRVECNDYADQVEHVVDDIKCLTELGYEYKDIAILYRTHSISRGFEERFMREGIPYKIYNGTAFYKRKEIKDSLAYLRLLVSNNDIDFLRIVNEPRRGFGPKKVYEVTNESKQSCVTAYEYVKSHKYSYGKVGSLIDCIESCRVNVGKVRISDLLQVVLTNSGYMDSISAEDERTENVKSLIESIKKYENDNKEDANNIEKYIETVSLITDVDKEGSDDCVKIMTLHGAKGLEFKVVFIVSMCDGILPYRSSITNGDIEEERRLAYVGMTRAQDLLYIVGYEASTPWGEYVTESRFTREIFEV